MQKITSRGQWELYLASIASAYDGKDSNPSLYSMNEANNFRYKVIVKNITKGIEIQDYIKDVKLSPNRTSSKIQSSKATFMLEDDNMIIHGDLMEVLVRNISETFEIKILSGKAKIENTILNNYRMVNLNITVVDEVENLYSKVVPEDAFVFDNYLNNNNDKNNSIYHNIMRKMGFSDTDLEIEDIVNSNGNLIRIPFMLFKEGNRWIDELFTALDSIGARIFITPEGKVRIENGVDKREPTPVYEFTENNVLNSFETRVVYPDKNGSKVIYDNFRYLENQIIFGLAEKVEVKVGTTPATNQKSMRIKYVSDIAKSYNLTKAEGYWYPGEDAASIERVQLVEGVHYELEELKSSGAVVKFFNPFPKVFYIDTFEISGIPLVKYEGNEYVFKNSDVLDKYQENFQSYQNNKYIQEEPLAAEVGKIIFLDKCKENTEYSFKCNFVPFLDIGDICTLNFLGKNELVRITSIEHSLGRERGCTSNIKAQKVIFLTPEEHANSSLESLNVSTSFLELKNLKEEIKGVEDEFKESEAWITGKIGAKAWISEEEPVGDIKDHDVWYKESTNEFKIWMNGQWNPAAEEDIMPALKSWIATQTAQLEMGKIIEQVGDDANSAYERAGIFLMNNDEKFGSMNGAIAEVSIDKNARILAKNVNNLLEFNTKDPTNPNVMTSKILMGVYDVNDVKHKNTAFQVGDEATGAYIKFDIARGVQHVNGNGEDIEDLIQESLSSAEGANALITEMASDNKLTASEKQQAKKEWEEIVAEYQKTLDKAALFGVDATTRTNYTNAYNTLNTYLSPLLSSLTTTSNIVGTTFRANFSSYFTNRQTILGATQDKLKDTAISTSQQNAQVLIDSLETSLQSQIDSKIDTWNQEADPSTAWTTDALKVAHAGDLWYRPSEKITRRYRRTGTNTGTWDILEAKDTVAQSLAQSKKRVFTAQPTTPYEVGDLWITNLSATADLMVCKTALVSGAYNAAHWVKGTKYTDDTVANNAQSDINNGRLVINANTTFNGTATIVSKGANETTEIRGGSITFTRNGTPISVIRNTRYGTANISNGQPVIITLTGFKGTAMILPSIREFNFSENTKSVECFVETVNQVNQQYRLYLRGVETVVQGEVYQGVATNSHVQGGLMTMRCPDIRNTVNTSATTIVSGSVPGSYVSHTIEDLVYTANVNISVSAYNGQAWNVVGTTSYNLDFESNLYYENSAIKVKAMSKASTLAEQFIRSFNGALVTLGLQVTTTVTYVVNSMTVKVRYFQSGGAQSTYTMKRTSALTITSSNSTTFGVYTSTKADIAVSGSGKVQYIAIEE